MKAAVGLSVRFKYDFDRSRYGTTAVVTCISWSIDQPHPGHVTHKWIDLITENGTRLQWSPATFKRNCAEVKS